FSASPGGLFDVIVSNPPYIPARELDALQPEVAWYEPRVALAAGTDGLDYHRRLLSGAQELLKASGRLILELGCGQADQVLRLAQQTGAFISLVCRKDAAGIERVFVARKAAGWTAWSFKEAGVWLARSASAGPRTPRCLSLPPRW